MTELISVIYSRFAQVDLFSNTKSIMCDEQFKFDRNIRIISLF